MSDCQASSCRQTKNQTLIAKRTPTYASSLDDLELHAHRFPSWVPLFFEYSASAILPPRGSWWKYPVASLRCSFGRHTAGFGARGNVRRILRCSISERLMKVDGISERRCGGGGQVCASSSYLHYCFCDCKAKRSRAHLPSQVTMSWNTKIKTSGYLGIGVDPERTAPSSSGWVLEHEI